MQRALVTSAIVIGLVLPQLGCRPHRVFGDRHGSARYGYDHDRDRDRGGAGGRLDVNSASIRELDRLPGLSAEDAQRIAAHRPYDRTRELVDRRIIGARKYDRIEEFVYAGRTRQERQYDDDRGHDHDSNRNRPYHRDEDRYQDRRFFDDR
jgi:hypothetical protein